MKKQDRIAFLLPLILGALSTIAISATAAVEQTATHPELSEQEMLIACASCHQETTPDIHDEWYESVHGIAMVKCYQCHGTFESFRVTPTKENCATCHADMLTKCKADKPCWECHVPHNFKAE